MPDDHQQHGSEHPERFRGPLTYSEMTSGLIWPLLFKSVVMALQPPRLVLAFALIVALGLLAVIYDSMLGAFGLEAAGVPVIERITGGLEGFADALLALEPALALELLFDGVFAQNLAALSDRPLATGLFLLVVAPLWAVFGGAVSRMVAVDIAGHLYMSAGDGLVYASRRMAGITLSLLIPLIAMGVLALVIAVLGTLLLGIPVVNAVGGALYGVVLVLGTMVGLLFVGFVLGQALLVPAISAESTDAGDAIQRSYSYVFNRPARACAYVGICLVQGVILFAIARWFVGMFAELSADLATSWIGDSRLLPGEDGEEPLVRRMILGWERIFSLLVPAIAVSHYFAASTITYLLLRRVTDGQDVHELWMPGFVGGTMAPREPSEPGEATSD